MKKMSLLLLLTLLSFLVVSCDNQARISDKNDENPKDTTTNVQSEELTTKADDASFDAFWELFKKAVASADKAAIQRLTKFGALTQEEFESTFEIFFEDKEAKSFFEKSTAADATPNESTFEGVTVSDVRQFSISFTNEVGESSLMYFFGKVDGKYRLVYLAAAG